MTFGFDSGGWLVANARAVRLPTVRICPLESPQPLDLVWHTTGGPCRPDQAERLALRIQGFRPGLDRPVSWHFLISINGVVFQSAPLSVGTWHVGRPALLAGRTYRNINAATVGIELENPGRLRSFPGLPGRFYCWPYYSNPGAPPAERRPDPRCEVYGGNVSTLSKEDAFADFPPAQEKTATSLLEALVRTLELSGAACAHTHRQFEPQRRADDPGPVFERLVLPRMLGQVFGRSSREGAQPNQRRASTEAWP